MFIRIFPALLLMLLLTGCSPELKAVYSNENGSPVKKGGAKPFQFQVYNEIEVVKIRTYHWNDGKGAIAGEIIITGPGGKETGRWKAENKPGRNGVATALWEAETGITLKPGIYTVTTSDERSWSYNEASLGAGFTSIYTKK